MDAREGNRVSTRDRGASLDGTETNSAYKTTELIVYVVAVIAVLIASYLVDTFDAYDAWRFITYLSIAYIISRGLAKAGSRAPRES
jgi:hypothetical protein